MKKLLLPTLIISALFISQTAVAKTQDADPFKPLWDAIAYLQEQIDNIELQPGPTGPQGEQGPKGDAGDPATHGAGNIAFMFNGDPAYLLKTDGTVWISNLTPGWGGPLFTEITSDVASLPVPVSDIVDWKYYSLIDKDGNYWYFDYHTGPGFWHNFGPLP